MTAEIHPGVLQFGVHGIGPLSDEAFEQFCAANPDLQIEREPSGKLIIMPPVHTESGYHESQVIIELGMWNRKTGLGKVFGPSAGFTLPDTSIRAADAS